MVKDPTHKHFFASATFDFFERGKLKNYFDVSSKMNFKILNGPSSTVKNRFLRIFNPLVNLHQPIYERFFAYLFPSQVLEVKLKVVK